MAPIAWMNFPFFDVSRVQLPTGDGAVALDQASLAHVAAGREHLYAALPDGFVHILQKDFASSRSWKAHDAGHITCIREFPDVKSLITVSEDLSSEPELKVWSLDQQDRKSGSPRCISTLTVQNGRKKWPVTAFTATSDLSQVAVGFANGAVTVVRGDLIHDRGTRQRTVFESDGQDPITGLEFLEANITSLIIATTLRILALPITGNKQGSAARKFDDRGCAVDCMAVDTTSNVVTVGRDDAIYNYGVRGKSAHPCLYEGPKKIVRVNKDYVLIVSPPTNAASRAGLPRAFGGAQAQNILNSSSFTILNTDLRFMAHQETLNAQVSNIFSIWGDIYLLTVDGKLFRYHEKTFQQKLDILYQRDLYLLAMDLARKYNIDKTQQNVIFRKLGDFLYQKGDYDLAMQQYLRAIDNTEPSQIIRKFLDNQRIKNLIEYLEELHEHHKATSDHTTLLLNCYAKLKDVDKLEQFIRQPGHLTFDLDTAIVMCRQGGYYDQAAFLARRHNEHGLVVDILVEDLKKYAEALAYIVRLEPQDAYPNFTKYGTVLLEHCAHDATQLFIDYFTGTFKPKKDAVIVQETPIAAQESGGIGNMAQSAVQSLVSLIPLPYMNANNAQPASQTSDGTKTTVNQVIETTTEGDFVEYSVPKPREAFSSFIDHPDEFIVFLQACIESAGVEADNKTDLYTTLFEMYLHKAGKTSGDGKAEWERKARSLIESKDVAIDTSNVLLLSDLEKFRDGTILVSEKHGLYFDIFRSYTAAQDTQGAIKALHRYGPEEPQLYPAALAYFTTSPKILKDAGQDEVAAVLKKIDEDGLMAPLQVIQTLSTTAVATMGLVKDYLSATVERERSEIAANRRAIDSYRADTSQKQSDLNSMSTNPTSFSATRCTSCMRDLELPTVHFLCKHSFHQSCLNIAEDENVENVECPQCAQQNASLRTIKKAQEERAQRHDLFQDALGRSTDKFGTVSDWFGRGVMDVRTRAGAEQ